MQQQANSLREKERVFREQQQSASIYLARCTALEEELKDLHGRFDLVHERWRRAQESQLLAEGQLQGYPQSQQHLLQRQEHAPKEPKDSPRGSDQHVDLLEGYGKVRGSSSSDSVSTHQEHAVGTQKGALASEVTNRFETSITPGDRSLQHNVTREEDHNTDRGFPGLSPVKSSAMDQSTRYTKFDFTRALVQKRQRRDEKDMLKAEASGKLGSRNTKAVATNRITDLFSRKAIADPVEIHFKILGDDGNYTLSQIVRADLSNMQPARSMVVKHLRKCTAMVMLNADGQIVNANNFHVGMTTTEVNVVRFVPYQILSSDSATPIESFNSPDQQIRRKVKGI